VISIAQEFKGWTLEYVWNLPFTTIVELMKKMKKDADKVKGRKK